MPTATLLIAAAAQLATCGAFLHVARVIIRRPTSPDARAANRALGLWWGLLGTYLGIQATMTALAAYDLLTLDLYLASRVLSIPLICGSVAALMFHLIYLFTGNSRAARLVALSYILIALLFAYATWGVTQELRVSAWLVGLNDETPLMRILYATIGLPVIGAAVAYATLLRRVHDPLQRRRLRTVSLAIATYVGSGLGARLVASDIATFITLVGCGLAAALLVLHAYGGTSPRATPREAA